MQKSYKVTVVTGYPNYGNYKFYKGYFPFFKRSDHNSGFKIIRIAHLPRLGNGFFGILAFYSSFLLTSSIYLFLYFLFKKEKKIGLITFCGSPVLIGLISNFYSKIFNIKSFLWIHDFWPEGIISSKILKPNIFTKYIKKIENFMYRNSKNLISQSPYSMKYFQKLFNNKNIYYFPSFIESNLLPIKVINRKRINICYTGLIGKTQNLEPFLKLLHGRKDDYFQFSVCGDGPEFEYLSQKYTNNIKWLGYLDKDRLTDIYSESDFNFISLIGYKRLKLIFPFKFISYLNNGKPILAYTNCYFGNDINKFKLGYSVTNDIDMIQTLNKIQNLSQYNYTDLSNNVKKYFDNNFDYNLLLNKFLV